MFESSSKTPILKKLDEDNNGDIEVTDQFRKIKFVKSEIQEVNFKDFKTDICSTGALGGVGFVLTYAIWNIISYETKIKNINQLVPQFHSNDLVQLILILLIFCSIWFICFGFLIIVKRVYEIFFNYSLMTIKTTSDIFEYRLHEGFFKQIPIYVHKYFFRFLDSPSITIENINRKNIRNFEFAITNLFIITPIILYIINYDKPFWFYQFFLERLDFISWTKEMTCYNGYFTGNPKTWGQLFIDGLASFGGLSLLIAAIILLFYLVLLLLLLAIIFLLLQPVILPFIISINFIKRINKETERVNFKNWNRNFGKASLNSDDDNLFSFIFIYLLNWLCFVILTPVIILYISFPKKNINQKNVIRWFVSLLASIAVVIFVNFLIFNFLIPLSYSDKRDFLYLIKYNCTIEGMRFSLFQLDKMFYLTILISIGYFTFNSILPENYWKNESN